MEGRAKYVKQGSWIDYDLSDGEVRGQGFY
jgi:hypothetical protein